MAPYDRVFPTVISSENACPSPGVGTIAKHLRRPGLELSTRSSCGKAALDARSGAGMTGKEGRPEPHRLRL